MDDDIIKLSLDDDEIELSFDDSDDNTKEEGITLITNDKHKIIQKKILTWLSKYRYLEIKKLAKYLKISQTVLLRELKQFPRDLIVWNNKEVRLDDYLYNGTKEEILEFWGG